MKSSVNMGLISCNENSGFIGVDKSRLVNFLTMDFFNFFIKNCKPECI